MYINFLILSENKVVFVDFITFVSGILFILIRYFAITTGVFR